MILQLKSAYYQQKSEVNKSNIRKKFSNKQNNMQEAWINRYYLVPQIFQFQFENKVSDIL